MATITDIYNEIYALTDTNSTSYPTADILRRVNQKYEEVVGKLIQLDGKWEFDDSNYTDLPVGTATMVNGQQDYSFDVRFLNVIEVEVKDANGNWHKLTPIDKRTKDEAISQYQITAGMPTEYDKIGDSIFLYPSPATGSVTLTNGLKVHYQRTADVFTSAQVSTGTKTPGFPSPWHMILAYGASIPYCMTYKKDRVAAYEAKMRQMEQDLYSFEAKRNKDEIKRIIPKKHDNK